MRFGSAGTDLGSVSYQLIRPELSLVNINIIVVLHPLFARPSYAATPMPQIHEERIGKSGGGSTRDNSYLNQRISSRKIKICDFLNLGFLVLRFPTL